MDFKELQKITNIFIYLFEYKSLNNWNFNISFI